MKLIKKSKLYWASILLGVLLILFGIMLLPVWGRSSNIVISSLFFSTWSEKSVNFMISALVLVYIFRFLITKLKKYTGTAVQIIAIVELVMMSMIAIGCSASYFGIVSIGGPCQIFGLALWSRGVVEIFNGYYSGKSQAVTEYVEKESKRKEKTETTEIKETEPKVEEIKEPEAKNDDNVKKEKKYYCPHFYPQKSPSLQPSLQPLQLLNTFSFCLPLSLFCSFFISFSP